MSALDLAMRVKLTLLLGENAYLGGCHRGTEWRQDGICHGATVKRNKLFV